jgi:hypothetical protein
MSVTKIVTCFFGKHDHDLDWASLNYVDIQCRCFVLAVLSLPVLISDRECASNVFALLPNFNSVSQNCTYSSAPKFDVEAVLSGLFSSAVQKILITLYFVPSSK